MHDELTYLTPPQLMDSATVSAHFEKFTNLTPLEGRVHLHHKYVIHHQICT